MMHAVNEVTDFFKVGVWIEIFPHKLGDFVNFQNSTSAQPFKVGE